MNERRGNRGSNLSAKEEAFLQLGKGIGEILKHVKFDIEGEMNLRVVSLKRPVTHINAYIQYALQHGINTFVFIVGGNKDLETGEIVSQTARSEYGLIEQVRVLDNDPGKKDSSADRGLIVLIKPSPKKSRERSSLV